jgi:hypothetical protein
LCFILCTSSFSAAQTTPSWEASAAQKMYDRAVEEGNLPAGAHCSAEYLARAGERAREARQMLVASLRVQSPDARVWAHALVYAAARGIAGTNIIDESSIIEGMYVAIMPWNATQDFERKGQSRMREASAVSIAPPSVTGAAAMKTKKASIKTPSGGPCLNLILYACDCSKYDAWRLYLYIESATDADGSLRADMQNSFDIPPNGFPVISTYYIIKHHNKLSRRMPGLFRCVCGSLIFPSRHIVHEICSRTGGFA